MYRSLKEGGRFGFAVLLRPPAVLRELRLLMDPSHAHSLADMLFYEPMELYEQLAVSSGFSIVKAEEKVDIHTFPNVEHLYKWYSASTHGKFNQAFIEKSALEEFEKQFVNKTVQVDFSMGIVI